MEIYKKLFVGGVLLFCSLYLLLFLAVIAWNTLLTGSLLLMAFGIIVGMGAYSLSQLLVAEFKEYQGRLSGVYQF